MLENSVQNMNESAQTMNDSVQNMNESAQTMNDSVQNMNESVLFFFLFILPYGCILEDKQHYKIKNKDWKSLKNIVNSNL